MSAERPDERVIFNTAAEIESPEERKAYLDRACGDDADLRAAVEELLRLDETNRRFLEAPVLASRDTLNLVPISEKPGDVIDRYKLLEQIGEGGFGVVYMAEQTEPIRRQVALKIIKLGMDTKAVVARFEAERQALALMDHPNIARVLDAGATTTGRPYFVMELVRGIPITEYCDRNNLSTEERLALFSQVCSAVQHAHQKGIIHRDLKPTNVLITLHDGTPVPKVIDFGIAKAMDRPLTDRTLFTAFRQFVGTPQYMSPEQAEMSALGVDTRSDIYSLGVLLYELLTGTTPLEEQVLRKAAYDELCRMIREVDPPPPSTRLSALGDRAAEVARHRHTEPGSLSKLIRGDLDWIVMKALEKDRTRRYETATDLAKDIQRHLSDEPVVAGPPGAGYRMRKFVRRHRLAVVTGLLVAASLLVGLSLATMGFIRASRDRDRAVAAGEARLEAERQRRTAEDLARAERQRAERSEEDATRRAEAERWRLVGEALFYTREKQYAAALARLKLAAAIRHDHVTRLGLWDLAERYRDIPDATIKIGTSEQHRQTPSRMVFGPDSHWLAVAGGNGVALWKPLTGEWRALARWRTGGGAVAVSPDGTRVAQGGTDGLVKIWEVVTGAELRTLTGHTETITAVAFSPDGATVASAAADTTVRLWDAATGEHLRTLQCRQECGTVNIAFSPDGSRVRALGSLGDVAVCDVATGESLAESHLGYSTQWSAIREAWHPGGRMLISGHGGPPPIPPPDIAFWHLPDLRRFRKSRAHVPALPAWGLDISPNGRALAIAASDGTIGFYDLLAGLAEVGPRLGTGLCWQDVIFSPDGSALASVGRDPSLTVWDLSEGRKMRQIWTMASSRPALFVGFSPDRTLLARFGPEMVLCEIATGAVIHRLHGAATNARHAAFSPDGTTFADLGGALALVVGLWSVRTGAGVGALQGHQGSIGSVEFSPDGRLVATGSGDGTVRLWDVATCETRHVLPGHDGAAAVAFSPDGTLLATAGGPIRLWEVATGRELRTLAENRGQPWWLLFSPDGAFLAAADPGLGLWDVATGREVTALAEGGSPATSLAFSPDAKALAIGTEGGPMRLWDLAEARELLVLEGHTGSVLNLAFRADGAQLASAAAGSARLWDAASGREIRRIEYPGTPLPEALAFTPDGRAIVAVNGDCKAMLWNLAGLSAVRRLKGHNAPAPDESMGPADWEPAICLAVSPDGATAAWAGLDHRIRMLEVATGTERLVLGDSPGARVNGLAFSPDGTLLASAGEDGSILLWEIVSQMSVRELAHGAPVHSVAFTPDGKSLVAGGGAGVVKVWDVDSGREVRTLKGHTEAVCAVAVSPDSALAASGSTDASVRIWDLASGDAVLSLKGYSANPNALVFSPKGRRLTWPHQDGSVRVWDVDARKEAHALSGDDEGVSATACSPDGALVAAGGEGGRVRLWRLATGEQAQVLTAHKGRVDCLDFVGPAGRLITGGADRRLKIWDLAEGHGRDLLEGHVGRIVDVAFGPDGGHLATAGRDGVVKVWDVASGKVLSSLRGHQDLWTCAVSPTGNLVAAAGRDATIRLWHAGTGREVGVLEGHERSVRSVAFSPGAAVLASASEDGTVRLWDVAAQAEIRALRGHVGPVYAVAFDPVGKRLASGGHDQGVRVWDAATGEPVGALERRAGITYCLAFSRDGKALACGGQDGTVRLWDVAAANEIRVLARAPRAVKALALSPDGKILAAVTDDSTLCIWDVATGNEIVRIAGEDDVEAPVAFSPDGRTLVRGMGSDVVIYRLDAHGEAIARWVRKRTEEEPPEGG